MRECTRRDFLRIAGVAAAGAALAGAGCGSQPAIAPPSNDRLASSAPPKVRRRPPLAVARGGDAAGITAAAIAALGGMKAFVKRGDDVIVKPNICTGYHGPEYAATTNPDVVGALVGLCLAAGACRVRVMDSPFGSQADEAYTNSGIQAAVEKAGGQMEVMAPARFRDYTIPAGLDLKQWPIYSDILSCDVLIDVPIAKDHGMTRLTLGGKNLLGVILDPGALHSNIGQRTADLVSACRPTLTVVDAVRVLTANGPTGGDLNDVEKLDTVIASPDIVAADSFAATLFDLSGGDIPYVQAAYDMGLGEMDLDKVDVRRVSA
ncbi:MAG: DUF362 domain-containing protein [Actinobacteria bacterium]|nr:DUF362 domain-containing protein [Actinomycetota bacterium]